MPLDFPNSPTNGQTFGNYYFDSSVGTSGAWRAQPIPVGGLPAGSIIQWGSNTAPANWLICDGAAVSRTVYPSLFAAIGTQYGAGDGSTTFNLPDLRGRVAVGRNSGTFANLGGTGGAESVTLTNAQAWGTGVWHSDSETGITDNISTAFTAGSQYGIRRSNTAREAHSVLQPYLVTNYIIKATAGWTAGDSELATRVGVLEAAPAGLVRVVPTSVAVGSGSASVSTTGVVTFSGASSLSLNNCFTNTFQTYRFVLDTTGSSTGAAVYLRFRNAGVDNTGANYYYGGVWNRTSGSPTAWASGGATVFDIGRISSNWRLGSAFDVYSTRGTGQPARISGSFVAHDGTSIMHATLGGHAEQLAPYDGLSLALSSGTITGTLQVYGYRN